jgi:hypothetical protein
MPKDPFIREKFTKLRTAARQLAAEYFECYPKDRYLTEVEGWRHLQSDNIEFTIKRLSFSVRHQGRAVSTQCGDWGQRQRQVEPLSRARIIQSLAAEGGLQSTLWAGPEAFSRAMKAGSQPVQGLVRKNPVSLKLGFSGEDYGYAIDLGLPLRDSLSKFSSDPQIKAESQWTGERLGRANAFAVRNSPSVRIRDDNGEWRQAYQQLASFDRMMRLQCKKGPMALP